MLSLWRWIVGAAIVFGTILFVAYQQHRATEKYQSHRQEYCAALVASAEEKKACIEESASASDYLPWGYKLLIWPEGITTWAILATGFAIVWQSWETRKAAKATKDSVELSAAANSQWVKLKLVDMYSVVEPGQPDPPTVISLNCRWSVVNPSPQPLTLHKVKVDIARDDAWHVSEFHFDQVLPPGEDGVIVIVPVPLNTKETTEYFSTGVEFSVAIHALFTGVNGRQSSESWGALYYFRKGDVVFNPSLGKGPQREYKEKFRSKGTIVPSGTEIYEFDGSQRPNKGKPGKPN